jgi:hypothetical protein
MFQTLSRLITGRFPAADRALGSFQPVDERLPLMDPSPCIPSGPSSAAGSPGSPRRSTLLALGVAALLSVGPLTGCEDPGVVGSTFLDEEGNIVTNSYLVDGMTALSGASYSGRLSTVPVGRYLDPLFGEVIGVGLLRPALDSLSIQNFETADTMRIRLIFTSDVYGDTLSKARFNVYEITEPWRGFELNYGDEVAYDPARKVAEFEVAGEDTVVFMVSDEWKLKYRDLLFSEGIDPDSAAVFDLPGLAIVPDVSSTQVIRHILIENEAFGVSGEDQTRLFVTDSLGTDQYQSFVEWGSSVRRIGGPSMSIPQGSVPTYNTLETYFELEFGFTEEKLLTRNLARVELVVYEDFSTVKGSLPENHVRPSVLAARIHTIDDSDPAEAIFATAPFFQASKDTTDGSFRFNLTSYANAFLFDTLDATRYFLSIEDNTGLIHSTLLHTLDSGDAARKPRIIVTAIE